jgi:hypothetical protein
MSQSNQSAGTAPSPPGARTGTVTVATGLNHSRKAFIGESSNVGDSLLPFEAVALINSRHLSLSTCLA